MVFEGGKFRISLYKVLLFYAISDGIKEGKLNLIYSQRYKNFEEYQISKNDWQKNKENLLTEVTQK